MMSSLRLVIVSGALGACLMVGCGGKEDETTPGGGNSGSASGTSGVGTGSSGTSAGSSGSGAGSSGSGAGSSGSGAGSSGIGNSGSATGGSGSPAGGSHGVDSSKLLKDRASTELLALCNWAKAKVPSPAECGQGLQMSIECIDAVPASCDKKVSDYDQCVQDVGGDACKLLKTASCVSLLSCAVQQ